MTRKSKGPIFQGVKKATSICKGAPVVAKTAKHVGIQAKDVASFLKQRMGKKVRDLRAAHKVAEESGDDDEDMADTASIVSGLVVTRGLAALAAAASERGDAFNREEEQWAEDEDPLEAGYQNRNLEAENTRKKFYVELRKVMANADVIIEVLDCRDPLSCRCLAVEKEVLAAGKKLVLLLNKIDLVPKPAVEAWTKHLQRSFPTIAFKAAHGNKSRCVHAMTSAANAPEGLLRSTHAVVGADEVMQLLKNYSRVGGGGKTKGHITVGIIGYPNTGKSSVINSMKRYNAVETGGRAGVTKVMQEVVLDSKVTLLDCPGVVFEGSSDDPAVVLRNVVTVESVVDAEGAVEALLKKAPPEGVRSFYGLSADPGTVEEFLVHVAKTRGKLKRGGGLDLISAARSVINDWTSGKFKYYVLPPTASSAEALACVEAETAEVVTSLAPCLDIDALFEGGSCDAPAVLGAPTAHGNEDDMDDGLEEGRVAVDMERMRAK